jgi:hypothetical protein
MKGFFPLIFGLALGAGAASAWFLTRPAAPAPAPPTTVSDDSSALDTAHARIAELEALLAAHPTPAQVDENGKPLPVAATAAGAPTQIQNIGDLVEASRPLLSRMGPMFESMMHRRIDRQVAQLKEQLGLTDEQAAELKRQLTQLGEDDIAEFNKRLNDPTTPPEQVFQRRGNPMQGEAFETALKESVSEEQYALYEKDKLEKQAQSLERAANNEADRLGRQLGLDDTQKDQVFEIYARTSKRFDPSLQVETEAGSQVQVDEDTNREDAIREILTPEQQTSYDQQIEERAAREARWRSFFNGESRQEPGK